MSIWFTWIALAWSDPTPPDVAEVPSGPAADPVAAAVPPPTTTEPPRPTSPALERPSAASGDAATTGALVDEAIRRIKTGDYDGARIVLRQAADRDDVDIDAVVYLEGVSHELGGDASAAIALYDQGLTSFPDSVLTPDRRFRKAEALATLDEPRAALAELRTLDPEALEGADRVKYQIVRAIAEISAGKTSKGLDRMAVAFADPLLGDVSFYEAKGRIAWARVLAEQADAIDLDAPEKKIVGRLTDRVALVRAIEEQVSAAARLQEPEWVLDGLVVLGDAYRDAGFALWTSRRPRELTDEQRRIYETELHDRVVTVLTKATQHYQAGIDLAERLGWRSRRVHWLVERKTALEAQIEAM